VASDISHSNLEYHSQEFAFFRLREGGKGANKGGKNAKKSGKAAPVSGLIKGLR
jgi:hypothetical protein